MAADPPFDPHGILAALQRHYVDYVLIGGLARVLRGTDELTHGVDICPSFAGENLKRLSGSLDELGARAAKGRTVAVTEETLDRETLFALSTDAGRVQIVGSPAGAPNGFVDLRRGATKEHIGHGLRPLVASTGDLARIAAALGRDQDLARLRELRRIMELEVDREQTLAPPPGRARRASRDAPRRGRSATR